MAEKNFTVKLPPMLSGDELRKALEVLPPYSESVQNEDAATRLMALSDLYQIYIPSTMTVEIYSKLYLALLRSLQKKSTKAANEQRNQNHRAIRQLEYNGIIGGFIADADGEIYDLSISSQLKEMQKKIDG